MEIFDITKITAHSTPVMLKKYIKAGELEVVDKIMGKYDYFKQNTMKDKWPQFAALYHFTNVS